MLAAGWDGKTQASQWFCTCVAKGLYRETLTQVIMAMGLFGLGAAHVAPKAGSVAFSMHCNPGSAAGTPL